MKKLTCMGLSLALMAGLLAGCGSNGTTSTPTSTPAASSSQGASSTPADAESDLAYVQDQGTLYVGITNFAPMDYKEAGSDEWIGFDADMAKLTAQKLGVEVQFVEIDWDQKVFELQSKNIDCIWNGMTIKDDLKENMDFSVPYSGNMQVCVINSANADVYTDLASMANAKIVVEAGSAGQSSVEAEDALKDAQVTTLQAQRDTLLELKSGTADVAVIDAVMAYASVGEGTDYADLMVVEGIELSKEEYGIGLRKGSDMTEKINAALQELADDGTVAALAEKYPSVLVTLEPAA